MLRAWDQWECDTDACACTLACIGYCRETDSCLWKAFQTLQYIRNEKMSEDSNMEKECSSLISCVVFHQNTPPTTKYASISSRAGPWTLDDTTWTGWRHLDWSPWLQNTKTLEELNEFSKCYKVIKRITIWDEQNVCPVTSQGLFSRWIRGINWTDVSDDTYILQTSLWLFCLFSPHFQFTRTSASLSGCRHFMLTRIAELLSRAACLFPL